MHEELFNLVKKHLGGASFNGHVRDLLIKDLHAKGVKYQPTQISKVKILEELIALRAKVKQLEENRTEPVTTN